ncbi:MAG: phosphopyruvate hydratase, partial [bacterium]|nr:phosphopyruvate hydratase [bacterium]
LPTSTKPSESVRIASEIFHSLGALLKEKNLSTLVGDEGGYSPSLSSNEEVFGIIIESAKKLGYENNREYNLAIDAAATEFYHDGIYEFKKTNKKLLGKELIEYYLSLKEKYNLISFEDPFAEDDWENFRLFTEKISRHSGEERSDDSRITLVVGDDLFVTNTKRIEKGIQQKAANSVLIKLNQIGTVSKTADAINITKKAGWKTIISHRSGETEDPFIADLAYGSGADFIKTGSMSRSERLAKYNRLLEIENQL